MVSCTVGKRPGYGVEMVYQHFATGLETLLQIANVLEVDVKELLNSSLDETIQTVRLVK